MLAQIICHIGVPLNVRNTLHPMKRISRKKLGSPIEFTPK